MTAVDKATGKRHDIKNCEMRLPAPEETPWKEDSSLLERFFMLEQSQYHAGENEFYSFSPQLLFLKQVPVVAITSIRFPADWILSYYKSFRLYWHYSDKSWLAKYNSSGEPGIVKGFLKVQSGRPGLYDPAQYGNFMSWKFAGTRPGSENAFAFDPQQWSTTSRVGRDSVKGFAAVMKVLNRFNLVYVLDLSKYLSPLMTAILGWNERRNVAFHKQAGRDETLRQCVRKEKRGRCVEWKYTSFEEVALGGCVPKRKKGVPKWQNRYPLDGCVKREDWDWWTRAVYLDYILYFWARRRMFDELCRRGLQVDDAAEMVARAHVM